MDTPTRTTNLPAVSAIDEVLGNVTQDGVQRTRRQSVENLARQLSGTAPLRYLSGVAPIFETEAELLAASITDKVAAWVINDPDVSKVGIWGWNGSAWVWALPLPYEIVPGVDAGAGTANAIQITTRVPVTDGMMVVFPLFRATTGPTVTVSVNGGAALTLMTPRDTDASALAAGQEVWFRVRASDSTARMVNDNDIATLIAQAEAVLADFQTQYLGQFAANPATDINGNVIIEGAFYWNTVSKVFRYWDGDSWETFPNATVADGAVTNAKLADGAVTYPKLYSDLQGVIDPLRGFNANGSTADDTKFAMLETTITGHRIDGRGRRYRITGDIPAGNDYVNGYWTVTNYEGDLTVNIPFDMATLPVSRKVLFAAPGQASWSEDSGWYEDGVRGVTYSSVRHQTGNRFVGYTQRGTGQHWQAAMPDFGRDLTDAPNAFYPNGECSIRGVEFKLVRRQAAGGSYPTDHRIYARNRARWIEKTDVVTPRDTLAYFRVFKADVDFEVLEGTKITVITAAAVGGVTINTEVTCTANNSLFMEFLLPSGTFTGTTKGGGFTIFKIPQSHWVQRKFAAGATFGEQLIVNGGDDALLTYQPAVCLSMAVIKSDLSGAAYISAGGGYGLYVVKVANLCAGVNEATVEFAKKQASWAGYGEPCFRISPVDENVVYVGLRRDDGNSPALAVTTDAFATVPTPRVITASGGWGSDNNIVPVPILGDDGEEHIFVVTAGNRGGNNPVNGWSSIPVYLLHTTKTVLAGGSGAVDAHLIGSENHFDMWNDVGPSGRSSVGVGTAIALPGGRLEGIIGSSTPMDHWDRPQGVIVSYMIDVSRWVGGARPSVDQTVELFDKSYCEWTGLSADVTVGNVFAPVNYGVETHGDMLTTGGVFVADRTGWHKVTISSMLSGNGLEQTAVLWDEDTGAAPAYPAFSGDLSSTFALFRAKLPVGTDMSVTGSATVYLRAGQRITVRAGANTTFKTTTIQNLLRWENVG
ncbi:hypothetical protein [Rhizobium arsenicireducens]